MIKIISAAYGTSNTDTAIDVTNMVSDHINNNSISLLVSNFNFGGDPFLGIPKFLYVKYEINDIIYEKTIPEDEYFLINNNIKFSVITLTYRRYELLQEAIQSYLSQDFDGESEMVIINDSPDVKYTCNYKNIRIINCDNRFPNTKEKLEFGFKQCKYNYIFRLDDDDLLVPWSLSLMKNYIEENPGYEVYRSAKHYGFINNIFSGVGSNVNNGNIYSKQYLNNLVMPDVFIGSEDVDITFGAKFLEKDLKKYTMIYRWGMNTYHLSLTPFKNPKEDGHISNDKNSLEWIDNNTNDPRNCNIELLASFKNDYYTSIIKWHQENDKIKIHCIGDSHSSVFSGEDIMQPIWPERSNDKIPLFNSYRIGPATAYQLESKINIINDIINKCVNKEKDSIMFCFGEVDCRVHLIEQSKKQNKTIKEIVKECVDRYISVIKIYKNNGYNVIAWGPIASWNGLKPYTGPSYGSCYERNIVTKEFNDYLKKLCEDEGIKFISIFYKMVDANLITYIDYLDDWQDCHIHLNQKSMPLIMDELKKNYCMFNRYLL